MTYRCKACGAEIQWIRMKISGRKMPINTEPVDVLLSAGTDSFVQLDGTVIIGRKVGNAWDDDPDANVVEAYESHFATCPEGGQFRNRQARTRAPGYR